MTVSDQNEAEYAAMVTELEHVLELAKEGRLADLFMIHSEVKSNEERLLLLDRTGHVGKTVDVAPQFSLLIPCSESALSILNVLAEHAIPMLAAFAPEE